MASYAKDLPPSYFAKSFLEVDYANDALFWQGHFNQELEDIKKSPYLGLQEQTQLTDLQEIVWNGLLSPYIYEKGLRKLGKKSLFSRVKSIRDEFQTELKEKPDVVLQHLRKTLVKSLEEIQNSSKETDPTLLADLRKNLTYYKNVLNAFDYAETLASLCLRIEENKGKLALSETQYESFIDSLNHELHKINKQQYFQINAERESIKKAASQNRQATLQVNETDILVEEEDKSSSSYFSYPFSLVKDAGSLVSQGVHFTLENPLQAITMGVAFQAAAVAAKSTFASPQQSGSAKDRLRPGINGTSIGSLNSEDRNQNFIDLASLSSTQGFMIEGPAPYEYSGYSVGSAGDFNGDGLGDVVIGATNTANKLIGSSYIIYGQKGGYLTPLDLASLNSSQGVIIRSSAPYNDKYAWSVGLARDFNDDGLSDIIIGIHDANNRRAAAGNSYVIYGKKSGYPTPIDLAFLNADQGVIIQGAAANDRSGWSVSSAGDFNGDGINDVIIGAPYARPQGRTLAGSSYVVYGKKGGYPTSIDLAFLNADQGVIIQGATASDASGYSVSSAGDFNGDNLSDVIIGAPDATPNGRHKAGRSYVAYGKKGGYPTPIDLVSLNTNQEGVIIEGAYGNLITRKGDNSGWSVSLAGDFNDDGLSDVIVGAPNADANGAFFAGSSYVVYGKQGGYPTPIDLKFLDATQGVILQGAASNDASGWFVGLAGDFNGDGINDTMVGAPYAKPYGRKESGSSYVIYGRQGGYPTPIDLNLLTSKQGVIIEGAKAGDRSGCSVGAAGDFNGDGLNDIIIGARYAGPKGRHWAGASYVIYGERPSLGTAVDKTVKK
ncbi:MAG: integrin alpha, partial [Bacillota bacterium]|nr:integrin alpha [Bacillota bacterium]